MKAAVVIAINVIGWPLLQLGIARCFIKLPDRYFSSDLPFYRELKGEITFYRHKLRIKIWKTFLPDGGGLVGGTFSKRRVLSRNRDYLQHFILETRRGEMTHWVVILFTPIFFFWNPPWARGVMALYALVSNLPCIIVQRYNRSMLTKITSPR